MSSTEHKDLLQNASPNPSAPTAPLWQHAWAFVFKKPYESGALKNVAHIQSILTYSLNRLSKLTTNLKENRKVPGSAMQLISLVWGGLKGARFFGGLISGILGTLIFSAISAFAVKHAYRLFNFSRTGRTNAEPLSVTQAQQARIQQAFNLNPNAALELVARIERAATQAQTKDEMASMLQLKHDVKNHPEYAEVQRVVKGRFLHFGNMNIPGARVATEARDIAERGIARARRGLQNH